MHVCLGHIASNKSIENINSNSEVNWTQSLANAISYTMLKMQYWKSQGSKFHPPVLFRRQTFWSKKGEKSKARLLRQSKTNNKWYSRLNAFAFLLIGKESDFMLLLYFFISFYSISFVSVFKSATYISVYVIPYIMFSLVITIYFTLLWNFVAFNRKLDVLICIIFLSYFSRQNYIYILYISLIIFVNWHYTRLKMHFSWFEMFL